MLLAGDVGGTKTLLGLFEHGERRPRAVDVRSYATTSFPSFTAMLDAFAREIGSGIVVDAAAAGAAGPVVDGIARLTNVDWNVDVAEMRERFRTPHAALLNDLEAMAHSAEVLTAEEVAPLQRGIPRADGNAAVIAAGTGLGEAYLHRVNQRFVPLASEGGHADFAPRTDREIELLEMLREQFGRAEVEHVLSGPGLLNLYRFTHRGRRCEAIPAGEGVDDPAAVSEAALAGRCDACAEALDLFVSAYGAEAGNLGLRAMATSGVYVGGGIAPKILPALQDGRFMEAFRAKGTMADLAARMPVRVILNPDAGLLGAAVYAQGMLAR